MPTKKGRDMSNSTNDPGKFHWLRWIDRQSILLAAVGGVVSIALMLNVVVDVCLRYFYNSPLPGTIDLLQYAMMPSLVALGLGYAVLRGEHIRINLLTAPTGERTQRIVEIGSMIFTILTTTVLIWFGIERAMEKTGLHEAAMGTPWLAIWPYRWV